MNFRTLREDLETLLADDLGVYTLANGATTPAVSVRYAGQPSPAGTVVSGLELVIERNPRLRFPSVYDTPLAFKIFTLYLVGWGDTDPTPAAEKITTFYPAAVVSSVANVDVPEGLGPQAQMRITLQFNPEPMEAAA